ncbi:hypothetical protein Thiosp_04472 [Thiorhodovibrio litoralis]|nr:hypothetical protein Thiosp_04472 [Thiorhodovibrio litoralis]
MMKTIEIDDDLAAELECLSDGSVKFPAIIEMALLRFIETEKPSRTDRDILDQNANTLNTEAEDVLAFQVMP